MDNVIYILFLCVFPPLILSLAIVDRKARLYVGFMIIGFYICFSVSGINGFFLSLFDSDMQYVTTTVTPITEEILKAIPIIVYAFAVDSNKDKLISLAFLIGIGFAIMENLVILIDGNSSISLVWAAIRGFAAACLHGVCTAMVAIGVSFVRQKRKLFIVGTFALLASAITTHAIYNTLVLSKYAYIGYFLPLIIYGVIIVNMAIQRKGRAR